MTIHVLAISIFVAAGVAIGAVSGNTRSCEDGGCPLTATPTRGAVWGGLLGLVLALALRPTAPSTAQGISADLTPVATAEAFQQEVLERPGTTLVYFHAPWCPACRELTPIVNQVARQRNDDAHFVTVNTDKAPDLARAHQVQVLPTSVVFVDGQERDRVRGAVSKSALLEILQPRT
jgi:thioredoxin